MLCETAFVKQLGVDGRALTLCAQAASLGDAEKLERLLSGKSCPDVDAGDNRASCLSSAPRPLSSEPCRLASERSRESERASLVTGRYTPFHVACAGGHVRCATLLRNAGADTSLRNDIGLTAWELAAELRRDDIAALEHTPVTLTDAAKCAHDRS